MRLLVDGRPVGAPMAAPLAIAYGLTSRTTYLGTYEGTCALPFRGDVDLVRLWSAPLDDARLGELAARGPGDDPAPARSRAPADAARAGPAGHDARRAGPGGHGRPRARAHHARGAPRARAA